MNVVLDTNVIASALLFRGATKRVYELWVSKQFGLALTRDMVDEYTRVLAYAKFKLNPEEIIYLIHHHILPYAEIYQVSSSPLAVKQDPSDYIFLACARKSKSKYIVSGDDDLLSIKSFEKTDILTVKEFISLFP